MNNDFVTYCNFSTDKLLIYTKYEGFIDRSKVSDTSLENLKNNRTKGILSASSKKKIRKIISLWCQAIDVKKKVSKKNNQWKKKQMTFLTLTLPAQQLESDKDNKRNLLNRFLIQIQRDSSLSSYLWCAEKQMNGNIHYHIICNTTIDWKYIRSLWNRILDDNGYIENYRQNQIHFHKNGFNVRKDLLKFWSEEKQFEAYKKGVENNWSDPNSTDIHSLEKVESPDKYMTKYMTKSIDEELKNLYKVWNDAELTPKEMDVEKWNVINEKYSHLLIEGKIWGCSKNLQNLIQYSAALDSYIEDVIFETINRDNGNKWENLYCIIVKNINLNEVKNRSPSHYNELIKTSIINYNIIYNLNENQNAKI